MNTTERRKVSTGICCQGVARTMHDVSCNGTSIIVACSSLQVLLHVGVSHCTVLNEVWCKSKIMFWIFSVVYWSVSFNLQSLPTIIVHPNFMTNSLLVTIMMPGKCKIIAVRSSQVAFDKLGRIAAMQYLSGSSKSWNSRPVLRDTHIVSSDQISFRAQQIYIYPGEALGPHT